MITPKGVVIAERLVTVQGRHPGRCYFAMEWPPPIGYGGGCLYIWGAVATVALSLGASRVPNGQVWRGRCKEPARNPSRQPVGRGVVSREQSAAYK